MSTSLELVLIALILAVIVIPVVLCVYVVKFLKEATLTMRSLKELTDVSKNELEPALKSINNMLKTIDNVSIVTNKQFDTIKKILTTLLGASCIALSNVKNKGGFFSGLISGFNTFRKRR